MLYEPYSTALTKQLLSSQYCKDLCSAHSKYNKYALIFSTKAIWKQLYSIKSATEKGTLYQIRNMFNRTSVADDPSASMSTCEDFLLLILHCHAISAANAILIHNPTYSVMDLAAAIVSNFVCLLDSEDGGTDDLVHEYGKEVSSLSLVWHGFHDAIRSGDGERLIYWKFLLVILNLPTSSTMLKRQSTFFFNIITTSLKDKRLNFYGLGA